MKKLPETITINGTEYIRNDKVEPKKPKKQEPRVGQICEFWDHGDKAKRIYVLTEISTHGYQGNSSFYWDNCELLTDPLTLGRTMAPKGAEWIAPWSEGSWAFFTKEPELQGDFFGGPSVTNKNGWICRFEAPTDGYGPMKLWEDE